MVKCLQISIEVFVGTSKILYGRELSAVKSPVRVQ